MPLAFMHQDFLVEYLFTLNTAMTSCCGKEPVCCDVIIFMLSLFHINLDDLDKV